MRIKNQKFRAHLIKYRDAEMIEPVWFWINPSSGTTLSPEFKTQEQAERWFDGVIKIHNETYDFLSRIKDGKLYDLKGRITEDINKKLDSCPFFVYISQKNILHTTILALSEQDAKDRVEEYIDGIEWIDGDED